MQVFVYFFTLTVIKEDWKSYTATGTSFFVSYSTQSSSERSTSLKEGPFDAALTVQPERGEKATGSKPRQSNSTIVFSFPESASV